MTLPRFCLNTDKPDSCSPTDVFHSFACTSWSVHSANGWWLSQTGLYIFSDPKRQGWPWLPQTPCKVSSSRLTLGPWAASPRSPPPNPQEKAPFLLLLPISGCSSPKPDLESDPGDWGLGAALHLGSNVPRRKRKVPIPPPPPFQEFFPGLFEAKHPLLQLLPGRGWGITYGSPLPGQEPPQLGCIESNFTAGEQAKRSFSADFSCPDCLLPGL